MIVDDSGNTLSFDHQLSYTIMHYRRLSFTLNMFKVFHDIVDDCFFFPFGHAHDSS